MVVWPRFSQRDLLKMLSGSNAIEISDILEERNRVAGSNKATRYSNDALLHWNRKLRQLSGSVR
jgi:hypothetical protein